ICLAQKMDAGDIHAQAELQIDPQETAGQLHDRLAELGPGVIEQTLGRLERGRLHPRRQNDAEATAAPKMTTADGTVDFNQPAALVRGRIHGLTPWPGCRVNWRCRATG